MPSPGLGAVVAGEVGRMGGAGRVGCATVLAPVAAMGRPVGLPFGLRRLRIDWPGVRSAAGGVMLRVCSESLLISQFGPSTAICGVTPWARADEAESQTPRDTFRIKAACCMVLSARQTCRIIAGNGSP